MPGRADARASRSARRTLAPTPNPTQLEASIAALQTMSKADLAEQFEQLYSLKVPRYMRREFILRAVAHRVQENAHGGPDTGLRRRLEKLAKELATTGQVVADSRPDMKVGARLMREWQGETHVVAVTDDGFVWRGTRYRSLSQIARTITGTRWSGPAFFGLDRSHQDTPRRRGTRDQRIAPDGGGGHATD